MIKPGILTQPNIPKPLHGVNPRSILGKQWWDDIRKKAYKSNNYCCFSCGVHKSKAKLHQWLEAHEIYKINYNTGEVKLIGIAPLCHFCHNFIHSGRLYILAQKGQIDFQLFKAILQHGFSVLRGTNSQVFESTFFMAKEFGIKIFDSSFYSVDEVAEWKDWHLLLYGKKYYSKFNDFDEWYDFYNKEEVI